MSHIGEFELIGRISAATPTPEGITGIGDDCAVIPQKQGLDTLVTTDLLIEGRHFLLQDVSPHDLGWKSAAVNISDIAAMGGRPTSAFLSIALPEGLTEGPGANWNSPSGKHCRPRLGEGGAHEVGGGATATFSGGTVPVCSGEAGKHCRPRLGEGGAHEVGGGGAWIDAFIAGFNELCSRFGVALLGGATSASDDKLFINVTLLGECPHGRALKRNTARPGDIIYVSGPLGDSGAGLRLILQGAPRVDYLIRKHYLPVPRVELGLQLAATPGVHAMMDISDGIGSDLRHILDASGTGATVEINRIPLSPELKDICTAHGWDPIELATCGGEDYELLFTAAPGTTVPEGCTPIGAIEQEPGLRWSGSTRDYQGFTHF